MNFLRIIFLKKKINCLRVFFLMSVDKNLFPKIFYDSFFNIIDETELIEKKNLKSSEICGICLNEYNTDMISYCEIHYICLECYKEADIGACINKCITKKLILYKKT